MSRRPGRESTTKSRQQRVGDALREDTRIRILQAAAEQFAAKGYAQTTVSNVAAAAGVSVQTLYLAWGSKRAILRAYIERALAGDGPPPADDALRFRGLSARERLTELATLVSEIAARAAIGWELYRDAAAVDPEIAAEWQELQLLRHGRFSRIVGAIPVRELAPGLSRRRAIDTAWAIASPETYDLLVRRLGYRPEEFRDWMAKTLIASLLPSEA